MQRRVLAGLICCVLGCGSDGATSPSSRTPRLGRYTYHAERVFGVSGAPIDGTLTLTFASADSIAGTWLVTGYQPAAQAGFFNADAYVLYARASASTITVAHRISRDGANMQCSGNIVLGSTIDCTLTYVGP